MRFPEFTEKWTATQIGNVLKIGNGKDYKLLNEGNIPVFGTGGYMHSVDDYLYNGETVFIGRKGTINKPFYYEGKFWTVDTLFYTHSFNGVLPKFVFGLFQNINWELYNEASGVPSLSKSTIEKIKCNIPSISEQQKISDLLFLLDERIETQTKIIQQLQSLIRGLNNTLYKYFPTENLLSFSEIGSDYSGLSGKTSTDFGQGDSYVTYVSVYSKNFVTEEDCGKVVILPEEKQNLVSNGDVLFTLSSETPEEVCCGAVYCGENNRVFLNSFCFGIKIQNPNIYSPYMGYFVNSNYFRKLVFPLAQGSTRFNLQKNDFLHIKISFPALKNQIKIYDILNTIEKRLITEILLLNKYEEQKKFLLSNMFI